MASEGSIPIKTVRVGHLNGTSIAYQLPKPIVGSKATLILIPTFGTTSAIYKPQVTNAELLAAVNLLVFEPLGQGSTKTTKPVWTLWDSAYAFVQAMDALGVKKAFVLGQSQGGMIAARMALYAPDRIVGIIPTVSILDNGPGPIEAGSMDIAKQMTPIITQLTANPKEDFALPDSFEDEHYADALGPDATEEEKAKFSEALTAQKKAYSGQAGAIKLRQATLALITRDSLLLRLDDIKCPVLWIAASKDPIVSEQTVKSEVSQFKTEVQVEVIEGAYHMPTWTHADEVNKLVIAFVKKYAGLKDARALREAVGMVDI